MHYLVRHSGPKYPASAKSELCRTENCCREWKSWTTPHAAVATQHSVLLHLYTYTRFIILPMWISLCMCIHMCVFIFASFLTPSPRLWPVCDLWPEPTVAPYLFTSLLDSLRLEARWSNALFRLLYISCDRSTQVLFPSASTVHAFLTVSQAILPPLFATRSLHRVVKFVASIALWIWWK